MSVRYVVWSIAAISMTLRMLDCACASDDNLPTPADVGGLNAAYESDQGVEITPDDDLAVSPTWTFRGGTVVLQRQADRPRALASMAGLGDHVLDASQLLSPMRCGPDIDIIHRGSVVDVELRYFAVVGFAANVGLNTTASPPFLPSAVVNFAGPSIAYNSLAPATLSSLASNYSQLRSFEADFRENVSPALTVLAGYRHIDLNERIFGQFSRLGVNTDLFSIQGFNRMDGFQLGGEAVLWRPGAGRFRLEGGAKVGVFGDATSNYGNYDAMVATASGAHTALMTEWSVTAVYQITPQIAARVGYQGLLLDGVALASEQIGVLNPSAHTGTVENSGTPIYQGLVANLEYAW